MASISNSYMANVKKILKKYYSNFNMQFENKVFGIQIFSDNYWRALVNAALNLRVPYAMELVSHLRLGLPKGLPLKTLKALQPSSYLPSPYESSRFNDYVR